VANEINDGRAADNRKKGAALMQLAVGFKLQGMTEYEVQARATREKTARLKALRLDRDAQAVELQSIIAL
jgi:hypothetical protein